ncbi:unnamed protein product [Lactuca virosa]|uniref:Uncharacterized protein n=1 Tax=Lactuca virosa TaxID=75947 RepID=A0AAU9LTE3_9ASTR|nr:unnamed protein product [Lactuca virosa]
MVLTTELNVQHPYTHLTSILDKLGLAQSLLVNLTLSLVSKGGYEPEMEAEAKDFEDEAGGILTTVLLQVYHYQLFGNEFLIEMA